jgi:hypothetical protein
MTFDPTEGLLVLTARRVFQGVATTQILRLVGVSELQVERPDSDSWIYTEITEAQATPIPNGFAVSLLFWTEPHGVTAKCDEYRLESSAEMKSLAQLQDMVIHVRYEVAKLIDFLSIGNTWVEQIGGLPAGWGPFAGQSMLEAALIHARCLAEFLRHTGDPEDTITAKSYVPDWHWTKGEGLKADLAEVHGRVAHLGMIRRSVQRNDDNFRWEEFLKRTAVPTLLDGFREFVGRLDADMVARFNQPSQEVPRIDLLAAITTLIGP